MSFTFNLASANKYFMLQNYIKIRQFTNILTFFNNICIQKNKVLFQVPYFQL